MALHRLRSTLARLKAELELAVVDGTPPQPERLLDDVRDALAQLGAVEDASRLRGAVLAVDDDARLAEITARGLRRLGFDADSSSANPSAVLFITSSARPCPCRASASRSLLPNRTPIAAACENAARAPEPEPESMTDTPITTTAARHPRITTREPGRGPGTESPGRHPSGGSHRGTAERGWT